MMSNINKPEAKPIGGSLVFPEEWTIFAAFESKELVLPDDQLKEIPDELHIGDTTKKPEKVQSTRSQYDFKPYFGDPPYESTQAAYVFIPLESPEEQEVTLGMGADWTMKAWINGEPVLDTLLDGNGASPPSIDNFHVNVKLRKGRNILAAILLNGRASAVLALGGPEELRKGDFESILPKPVKLTAENIFDLYPPDEGAPFRWLPPETFNLDRQDLGFPEMKDAKHFEILTARKCDAPMDEGGSGRYESLEHGCWNHNNKIAVFKDRLIAIWDNHTRDENGPGSRVIARVGKILDPESGEVDWGGKEAFVELAPPPVPVRRRKIHSDTDVVRGGQATGQFYEIQGRLFFCGSISALHGITTNGPKYNGLKKGELVDEREFFFGPVPEASASKSFMRWDFGVQFYQEWDVVDDKLQPVSPLYKSNDQDEMLEMTSKLKLPLEPLIEPYRSAPLLKDAPEEFQKLILKGDRKSFLPRPNYEKGTQHLTEDGTNGLVHGTEFVRPDGAYVAVRENQKPKIHPVYYGAVKPDKDSFYPPAKRTNMYGAVNPSAGSLPDGSVYVVANSPNRRTMFIMHSKDGIVFDKTWFLMFKQLSGYTPGAMKSEGGPGAGPQYFQSAVVGNTIWLVYSISKEHVGATSVPIHSLRK